MKAIIIKSGIIGIATVILAIAVSCNYKRQNHGSETGVYQEKYRPQYHFSPPSGWMNDPNGLVYFQNEYHLFYQHFPDSTVWGPMHWGHAVSTDLVHWKNLPIALFPDTLGYIFSGSTVVDSKNTSGLGDGVIPPLAAIFTYHNPEKERTGINEFQYQGLAFSRNSGRTWIKYAYNPVLPNPGNRDFRDPKVFWYDKSGKWIMILAVHDRVHLYSSPDLRKWSFESEFGENAGSHDGVWECPDLFPLSVEGTSIEKWVMLVSINPGGPNGGSATQYFTGEFDGKKFVPDNIDVKWMDYGADNYAGVTYSGIPSQDGRRILIGWMSNWNYATVVPASTWRSTMTIPRALNLFSVNGKYHLSSSAVNELLKLRRDTINLLSQSPDNIFVTNDTGLNQSELEMDLATEENDTAAIRLGNNNSERLIIGYSGKDKMIFIDRSYAGDTTFSKRYKKIICAPYNAGPVLNFHIFLDATSAELFVDGGKIVMTTIFFPDTAYSEMSVLPSDNGNIVKRAKIHHLKSIWN